MAEVSTVPQSAEHKKPRRALRIARIYMGEDYDEEEIPAEILNLLYGGAAVFILAALALLTGGGAAFYRMIS